MTHRILVVDDEDDMQLMLRFQLSGVGREVLSAGSVQEGAAMARAERPDVIVLDHRLPDGTGTELVERLQEADLVGEVVIFTANVTEKLEAEVGRLGVTLCPKVELGRLKRLVSAALEA